MLVSLLIISVVLGAVASAEADADRRIQGDPRLYQSSAGVSLAGELINWKILSGGGNRGTSTNYVLNGTVGQTAVGPGTTSNYKINQGYWQTFEGTSCCIKAGDANHSSLVNIQDITYLINFLYKGGPIPSCYYEGDANGSKIINIQDITYLINYLYKGGPAPICP